MRGNKFSPTEANIMRLYEQDRNVVNFDKLLISRYWLEFDGWDNYKTLLENMVRATPASTITRARRVLHENGYIIYSKSVAERRERLYKEKLEEHSKGGFFKRMIGGE